MPEMESMDTHRTAERIDKLRRRTSKSVDDLLQATPDDYPREIDTLLTELGEAVIETTVARSWAAHRAAQQPDDTDLRTEHETAERAYRAARTRFHRTLDRLAAQHAAGQPLVPPAASPTPRPRQHPDSTGPAAPQTDDLPSPGQPLTDAQIERVLAPYAERVTKARRALETLRTRLLRTPPSPQRTAEILARVAAERDEAARRLARKPADLDLRQAHTQARNRDKNMRAAWNRCADKTTFVPPDMERYLTAKERQRLDKAVARRDAAVRAYGNARRRLDREKERWGTATMRAADGKVAAAHRARRDRLAGTGTLTDESRAKGRTAAERNRAERETWLPFLLWPADAEDTAVAREIMDRSNGDPEHHPGYYDGDEFYCIQPGWHIGMHLRNYLRTDVGKATLDAVTRRAQVPWRAAGSPKHELQRRYVPWEWAKEDETIYWHVVPIPGSQRWVVADRHLERVVALLADARCPHRLIEFPGIPRFGERRRSGDSTKPLPAAIAVATRDEAFPALGPGGKPTGNPSFSGITEANLAAAVDSGLAVVVYEPAPADLDRRRGQIAARLRKIEKQAPAVLARARARDAEKSAAGRPADAAPTPKVTRDRLRARRFDPSTGLPPTVSEHYPHLLPQLEQYRADQAAATAPTTDD